MKHIHFVIHRLKSIITIIYCCYLLFFLDTFLPLSRLIIPNPHGKFELKKRNIIFQGNGYSSHTRSIILKEGISDGILEVFIILIFL
jgi:hypothetical protein